MGGLLEDFGWRCRGCQTREATLYQVYGTAKTNGDTLGGVTEDRGVHDCQARAALTSPAEVDTPCRAGPGDLLTYQLSRLPIVMAKDSRQDPRRFVEEADPKYLTGW